MRSVATAPVVPISGARKIGTSATGPAFSTRSPMRTTSLETMALALSAGAGVSAAAAPPSVSTRAKVATVSRVMTMIFLYLPFSAHQLRSRLQHFVGGGNDFGIHLVGALRRDQIGDFGYRLDVGLFEIALLQRAGAVCSRQRVLRRARGGRGREQVVAVRLQAGIVGEARDGELAENARCCRAGQHHRNLALLVDGQPARILRDGNGRLNDVAFGGDD